MNHFLKIIEYSIYGVGIIAIVVFLVYILLWLISAFLTYSGKLKECLSYIYHQQEFRQYMKNKHNENNQSYEKEIL